MESMAISHSSGEESDEWLVVAAREGNSVAFGRLVARYRDVAFAYAYARLRHRDEAEDIVQEAFVRAFVSLPGILTSSCWAGWLMRILRNLCHDATRRQRIRKASELDDSWPDGGPTPEMFLLDSERTDEVRTAIATLPEKLRVPLLMHYVSRRTYREIALALDIPETTVVGRLATALRQLRHRCNRE